MDRGYKTVECTLEFVVFCNVPFDLFEQILVIGFHHTLFVFERLNCLLRNFSCSRGSFLSRTQTAAYRGNEMNQALLTLFKCDIVIKKVH